MVLLRAIVKIVINIPIMKPHMLNNWTNTKDISLKNFMEYASS